MQAILLVVSILFAIFGGYSWFVLNELNGFQKGCYILGLLAVISGHFWLAGPLSLVATSLGCLFIFVPCYTIIKEYMP